MTELMQLCYRSAVDSAFRDALLQKCDQTPHAPGPGVARDGRASDLAFKQILSLEPGTLRQRLFFSSLTSYWGGVLPL